MPSRRDDSLWFVWRRQKESGTHMEPRILEKGLSHLSESPISQAIHST